MATDFRKWLKKRIAECDLNPSQLSDKSGVSKSEMSRMLSGEREPSAKALTRIAPYLLIDTVKLFQIAGIIPPSDKTNAPDIYEVPVISWVMANRFSEITTPENPSTSVFTTRKGENMFGLKVRSDCMIPEFNEGDIIIIKPDSIPSNGDYVVVRDTEANEATFKQYKEIGKEKVLHPLNPKYQDIILEQSERYEIVGVVVEKIKQYK